MMQKRLASLIASLVAASASTLAIPASAEVRQPDGSVVPDQTISGDYFDESRYNVSTLGLGTMLTQLEGGQVDYRRDAATEPAKFSPLCGLQGSMIMRGGSCQMDFGWYCVDNPPTLQNPQGFVSLVTAQDVIRYHDALTGANEKYKNDDKGFVPLIGLPPVAGQPLENVRNHPVFLACPSQQIGFAIWPTNIKIPSVDAPVCTQPKYSEAIHSPPYSGNGQPWVNALTYASKVSPGVFYIAFEDLPNGTTEFVDEAKKPEDWNPDYDFNDFVYMVQGIQCEGGGQICDTLLPGICSIGVTECTVDGTPGGCTQKFQPSPETCDNIDNDCDGYVDGDGLCPAATPICFEGNCVKRCGGGEFECPGGYSCDDASRLCMRPECKGVTCGAGQRCVNGQCQGGCQGVVCLEGKECVAGTCVDLCEGQTCPNGFVCQKGACIADCNCLPCASGFTCAADGRCLDAACAGVVCDPGYVCQQGTCVDVCLPCTQLGLACVNGTCMSGTGGGDPGVGGNVIIGSGGNAISTGGGGGIIVPGTGGTGATVTPTAPESNSGCSCRSTASSGGRVAGLLALLLGLGVMRRRRASL